MNNLPKGYRLQYWNNSFWVEIANVIAGPSGYIADAEPIHEIDPIQTSAIRIILTPEKYDSSDVYFSGYIREIEVWGNM